MNNPYQVPMMNNPYMQPQNPYMDRMNFLQNYQQNLQQPLVPTSMSGANQQAMWAWWGTYGLSATLTAIDRALNGNKARAKYIEKSLSEQYSKDNEPKYKESNEERCIRTRYERKCQ